MSSLVSREANAGEQCLVAFAHHKIQPQHLERLAVVYVRQSLPRQLLENHESTELQYSLARRAEAYGWHPDRVLVIDDDLGQSARSAENRLGFQRLLAEVGLNHVGLVLGIEMSRLARSCKDWYHLLELCAVFGALLADQDGLYDPCDYNDRLLLGLKGTMSEAEWHILRGRMDQGRRNKARRGELFGRLPLGYVFGSSGEVLLDPDEQSRSLVRLIFDKFEELGTGRGVVLYLKRRQIRLPFHIYAGPNKGGTEWRLPSVGTVYGILRHPFYAGAYAYGRRRVDPRRRTTGQPHSGRVCVGRDEWEVLLPDRLPAYISWKQYLANLEQLTQNRATPTTLSAPREGQTLLGGLVRCGRCGWRMRILYHANSPTVRYECPSEAREGDHGRCQGLAARVLDDLISRQVLKAVEPASLALSLRATEDIEHERQRVHTQWQQRLERARYQVDRARRQYEAVEPENRLVARELERQWEDALREHRNLEDEHDRLQVELPRELSVADRASIESLSGDLPALWNHPDTTPQDRQRVVRTLVDRVVVNAQGKTEFVDVSIHWAGEFVSHHEIRRPVGRYDALQDFDRLQERLIALRRRGKSSRQIADCLNAEGFYPPRQDHKFTTIIVRALLSRIGLSGPRADSIANEHLLGADEWWLQNLGRELGIPRSVLCKWCYRGWVHARKVSITRCRWIVWADAEEQERLRQLHTARRLGPTRRYPAHLTTPKPPPTT